MEVRELNYRNKAELARVAEIYSLAFSQPPWNENWSKKEALGEVKSWKNLIKNNNGKVFVAHNAEGKITGVAVGHEHIPGEHSAALADVLGGGKHYYLREVAVDPSYRRTGVATVLTAAREKHARSIGAHRIVGRTRFDNTAKIDQFLKEKYKHVHSEEHETGGVQSKRVYYMKRLR